MYLQRTQCTSALFKKKKKRWRITFIVVVHVPNSLIFCLSQKVSLLPLDNIQLYSVFNSAVMQFSTLYTVCSTIYCCTYWVSRYKDKWRKPIPAQLLLETHSYWMIPQKMIYVQCHALTFVQSANWCGIYNHMNEYLLRHIRSICLGGCGSEVEWVNL